MKNLAVLGAGAIAAATVALLSPAVAAAEPASASSLNVVGEPYARAMAILKSQGVKAYFGGAVGSDYPQAECIVNQQKVTGGGRMYLNVDCTEKAVLNATSNAPAAGGAGGGGAVKGAPAPGAGQGTYGNQVGVPVPVG
ncbi:hypothetical protein [Mycolicibacterium grossiae]|uniref:PASTA domain-containing protein n=1 Tax=Mycolicibacterium grossiae TaxID=1552759 RepID=A0A1E8PZ06_9MYCO|nr:hypothetical protein [Mycolicibacterium grossiae]OFJ51357.1 hypothetical protein BEL07_23230 [Mycolicibacterium grossiae]QEM46699.1 hypothetical protein FZ046_19735 [Mycolicibacterium grossiae]